MWDLDAYRDGAGRFLEEIEREYYLHLSGRKRELEIEQIYSRHRALFSREPAERLRELLSNASGDDARRLRYLLQLTVEGYMGLETREEAAQVAELEVSLELDLEGEPISYRSAPIAQSNEPDGDRRAQIEAARNALLEERINPLLLAALERERAVCVELGWSSYLAAFEELRGIGMAPLRDQLAGLLEATDGEYAGALGPELRAASGVDLERARRSDLPRFFRSPDMDGVFPPDELLSSFTRTAEGLGIDLKAQGNIHLDTEPRPTKSPRAFCSTPHVPGEVYLVIAPSGGRDDYAALFHEGGHAEHYGCTDAELAFEFRQLGDNSVTESFAFLLESRVSDPGWLSEALGIADADAVVARARASKLVMLRRYAAKIAYEVELHGGQVTLERLPALYSGHLSGAIGLAWPEANWLSDVDGGFYVACYLRAWALETHWRRALQERFGEAWHDEPAAGEWLRGIWSQGQRLDAEELLEEVLGEQLDFGPLAAELVAM